MRASTIAELIAAAKAQPDKLNIALPSTTARIVFELLKARTGAPLFGVPYKGSATAMTEVMGGQVPAHHRHGDGQPRPCPERQAEGAGDHHAEVERTAAGREVGGRAGLPRLRGRRPGTRSTHRAARRRTIVDRLNAEVAKVLAQPETRQRLMQLGFEPAGGSPEALAAYEKQERAKWGRTSASARSCEFEPKTRSASVRGPLHCAGLAVAAFEHAVGVRSACHSVRMSSRLTKKSLRQRARAAW